MAPGHGTEPLEEREEVCQKITTVTFVGARLLFYLLEIPVNSLLTYDTVRPLGNHGNRTLNTQIARSKDVF